MAAAVGRAERVKRKRAKSAKIVFAAGISDKKAENKAAEGAFPWISALEHCWKSLKGPVDQRGRAPESRLMPTYG